MPMNLPNLLTWARIIAIPLLVAAFHLPAPEATRNLTATTVFLAAAVTDWFDGFLARRLGQMTPFGAFLDPVADKLLVCTALVMLVALGRVDAIVAVVIIGREVAISALREWMASVGRKASVAVHKIGKFKTVAQLVAIPMLLHDGALAGIDMRSLGTVLILVAAALTIWSMLYYLRQAWPHLREVPKKL